MMRLTSLFATAAVVATAALAAAPAQAQVSEHVNFQGRLTSAAGVPITTSTNVIFRLFAAATGGSSLWSETIAVTPNSNGIYAVRLGVSNTFASASIVWNQNYYLEVEIQGDASGPMTPRYQLTVSPFSFRTMRIGALTDAGLTTATTVTDANLSTLTAGTSSNADSLHAHSLASSSITGTLPDSKLSTNVALLNAANAFTGNNSFSGTSTFTGAVTLPNGTNWDGLTSAQFLRSDTSDAFTSGTLTFNAGTTLGMSGTLSVASTGTATFANTPTFSNGAGFTLAVGTSPFTVTSTTRVNNLNADQLDSLDSTNFAQLAATQTVSGAWTFTTAPAFNTSPGAPFTTNSTALVTNLNADLVDSLHAASFLRSDAGSTLAALNTLTVNGTISVASTGGTTFANRPAFTSPTVSGSPFTVASTVVVVNLNADTASTPPASR